MHGVRRRAARLAFESDRRLSRQRHFCCRHRPGADRPDRVNGHTAGASPGNVGEVCRTRDTARARHHLTAAAATFERLNARPWTRRAANELRASGIAVDTPRPATLTVQQRQIAELATAGMTNKQIAERLVLSPRTVSTHLYQLFPKLGITTRAALRDALAGLPDPDAE
ncbi:helix-turn-helix transcriptional regulator [Kribbella sp. NPDC003505]|uniref:helix-turn-helix transcriptional regulator n=1 Tax=Kribbella sp. NPDC003505 TaxID=3154448 RepID=UPI0033A09E1D